MKSKKSLSQENLSLADKKYSLKEFIRQLNFNNLKLKKIESILHGSFQSTTYGTGFDFNEIREYKIGDDLRHISWSSSAKTGNLYTKEYFAEKEIRSYFLIDISPSMFCGNKVKSFINTSAFLLNLATSFSEKVGGVLFSDEIKIHFPCISAITQANIIFQTLINHLNDFTKSRDVINHVSTFNATLTNLYSALEFTKQYFKKKGLIFLISDFINLSGWEKLFYEVAQKQNIYSFQILDPLDYNLPKKGYVSIIDPETKQLCTVNTDSRIVREEYKKIMDTKQEKLKDYLHRTGANHMIIEKDDFS